MQIACIIPTYNGRADLNRLIQSLKDQSVTFDLIIVDSGSVDGTAELGQQQANTFIPIDKRDFNHGGTRQMIVNRFPDYDIFVFLTQDAVLDNPDSIKTLVDNFKDLRIGAVCARQLPHLDANHFAEHARLFNYPPDSRVVDKSSASNFGLKAAFMSNSFSAYRAQALREVGGFPANVILSEDMYVGARMILSGWKIAYDSEAICRHSHNYTIKEEFKRYFDQGVFHAQQPWIRHHLGGASGEGYAYLRSELRFLARRAKVQWPVSLARSAAKLLGFKLGQMESSLPIMVKKGLSMHRGFWK